MKRGAVLVALLLATATVGAAEEGSGTTIVGDQDAAVGLYLAPWKNEEPADIGLVPGLQDEVAAPVDSEDFSRVHTYHSTLRAWRIERLQKNR